MAYKDDSPLFEEKDEDMTDTSDVWEDKSVKIGVLVEQNRIVSLILKKAEQEQEGTIAKAYYDLAKEIMKETR